MNPAAKAAPERVSPCEARPVEEWAQRWDVPHVEVYNELPSTNDHLRVLAESGAAHFTGILAIRAFVILLARKTFHRFAIYCWALGASFLLYLFTVG